MAYCEQFIFTAAKIGINEGYQIVAKSEHVPKNIDKKLRDYIFPLGIDLNTFSKSKSLLVIDKNLVLYSIVKNIGIGYDGRKGTLYNHSFIIPKDEFQKLDFDSRLFDGHFIENPNIRGNMRQIQLVKGNSTPDFKFLNQIDPKLLKTILYSLFKKSKIALVDTNDINLIQNLLAILPPSMRLIPFSTVVYQPDMQYKYSLMQIPSKTKNKLDKQFVVIDSDSIVKKENESNENLEILMDIIRTSDYKALENLHSDYEKILSELSTVRRIDTTEIFDESKFIKLAQSNDFLEFKNKINELYLKKGFNNTPPNIILKITKKIRKLIKKSLKKKRTKGKEIQNKDSILVVIKILLDAMNYLETYRQEHTTKSTRDEIHSEINKLKEIMNEYFPKSESHYMFNGFEYLRMYVDVTVKLTSNLLSFMLGGR